MDSKKRILLKVTGEIFLDEHRELSRSFIEQVIGQIKELSAHYQFGIVIGGGNFFRGRMQGERLGLCASIGHQIGMLATMMNGLILKDLIEKHGMIASHFCAIPTPEIGKPISQQSIDTAIERSETLIFSGGTGNPFFTTDTNAILRALQIHAHEVWKGTNVSGIYTADPHKESSAQLLKKVDYNQVLCENLSIMDQTAIALAREYKQPIRIFDIFQKNALIKAAQDNSFGSTIA